jgi:AcrR family transcriptional regulator
VADEPEFRRQQRGEESRKALLDAGVELLREEGLSGMLAAVSSRSVSRRAHRSTGAFFHHWPSSDAYVSDLIDHILRPAVVPDPLERVGENLDQLAEAPTGVVEALRATCRQDFVETAEYPALPLQMLLWSKHDDGRVCDALRRFYAGTDEFMAPRIEAIAGALGLEPLPPFDYETISVIFSAAIEGLLLRYKVEPARVADDLFGDVVLALIPALFRRRGQTAEFSDLVAEIDRYPFDAADG